MFRGDGKEMLNDQESMTISKDSNGIKKSDTIRQQVGEAMNSAVNALGELQAKAAALEKEKEEQAKASASSSGLFKHEQQNSNHQAEPQGEPKPKKGKGGCNIL